MPPSPCKIVKNRNPLRKHAKKTAQNTIHNEGAHAAPAESWGVALKKKNMIVAGAPSMPCLCAIVANTIYIYIYI